MYKRLLTSRRCASAVLSVRSTADFRACTHLPSQCCACRALLIRRFGTRFKSRCNTRKIVSRSRRRNWFNAEKTYSTQSDSIFHSVYSIRLTNTMDDVVVVVATYLLSTQTNRKKAVLSWHQHAHWMCVGRRPRNHVCV